jgi:hypothetical protein
MKTEDIFESTLRVNPFQEDSLKEDIESLKEWKSKLRKNYDNSFEQFKSYDEMYSIASRLGYDSAEEAWEANPVISGSADPTELTNVSTGYRHNYESMTKESIAKLKEKNPVKEEQGDTVTADAEGIVLLVKNERPIYDQFMMAVQNLKRKKAKGNYDHDLAVKMMLYPAKAGAQAWFKANSEYYDDGTTVLKPSPQVIQQAAEQLRDHFEKEYDVNKWE